MSSNARTANASRIRRVVTRKLIAKTSPTSSTVLSDTKLAKYAVRYDSLPSYVQNLYRSSNIELIQHAEKAFIAGTNKTNQNPHKPKKKKMGFNCNSSQIMSQCFVRVLFITISSLSFWRDSTTNSKTSFTFQLKTVAFFFCFPSSSAAAAQSFLLATCIVTASCPAAHTNSSKIQPLSLPFAMLQGGIS